jgi:hypothetical protein
MSVVAIRDTRRSRRGDPHVARGSMVSGPVDFSFCFAPNQLTTWHSLTLATCGSTPELVASQLFQAPLFRLPAASRVILLLSKGFLYYNIKRMRLYGQFSLNIGEVEPQDGHMTKKYDAEPRSLTNKHRCNVVDSTYYVNCTNRVAACLPYPESQQAGSTKTMFPICEDKLSLPQ